MGRTKNQSKSMAEHIGILLNEQMVIGSNEPLLSVLAGYPLRGIISVSDLYEI